MKTQNRIKRKNQPLGWLFVSPFVIGLVLYFIHVLAVSLQFGFSTVSTGQTAYELEFTGIANYQYAFKTDTEFVRHVFNATAQLLYNTPIILIFSLFIAVLLNQNLPGRTLFRTVFFLPVIVSAGIIASADSNNTVLQVLSSSSAIDTGAGGGAALLSTESIEEFFANLNFSPALIGYVTGAVNNILDIIDQSGVQIIIFLAGLQSISDSIYEYAKTEGATGWDIFWKITFPLIRPMMLVNLFYTVIAYTTSSDNIVLRYVNNLSFGQAKFGEASAMAWIYFAVIAVIILIAAGFIMLFAKSAARAERRA